MKLKMETSKTKLLNKNNFNKKYGESNPALNGNKKFKNEDGDCNVDDMEMTKLRPRGSGNNSHSYESYKPPPDNVVYLEREIVATDTLQSFALLYGCTVNDLKRANSLISEQHFYALRNIKIPIKRHSLLLEPEEEAKRRPLAVTSLAGTSAEDKLPNGGKNEDVYINDSADSVGSAENSNLLGSDAGSFLKKVDKEIRKTVRKSDALQSDKNEVLEEVVSSSLGSIGYRPLPPPSGKFDECNGSDFGFKWWIVLLAFVCLFVVIVAFIIYEYNGQQ